MTDSILSLIHELFGLDPLTLVILFLGVVAVGLVWLLARALDLLARR